MSLSRVTVLYSENKLQTTIKFPSSTTVADVKRRGSEDILNHLCNQPGVSETISIDDDRTEFHPGIIQTWTTAYIFLNLNRCSEYRSDARCEESSNHGRMAKNRTRITRL
jgi:hypothetical protein